MDALEVQKETGMKKSITTRQSPRQASKASQKPMTVGMDLGDKSSRYCALNEQGEVAGEGSVETTKKAMTEKFGRLGRTRIAMEVGTHLPWVSRLLASLGHEVIVANARQVRLITASTRKDDKLDARMLARLARIDPALLRPIRHRSEKAQEHLLAIRVRATLVDARTGLVNAARGFAKAAGERLPACDADSLDVETMNALPAGLQERLRPLLEQIESLTVKIKEADQQLEQIARIEYPETKLLRQVSGVGVLIALTFVLTVEDSARFEKSRDVGCYVGRPLCRPAAQAQRVGPEPARAAHHQGG
jgi:transposase